MTTTHIAGTPQELGSARLTDILLAAESIGPECRVVGVSHAPVGDGMMSDSFRLSLSYNIDTDEAPRTLVAKMAAADPTSKATAQSLQLYETEVLFYEQLAHTVDVATPRVLYSAVDRSTQEFTLVMEDLAPARNIDQLHGCSLDDCATAMREMARLHGPRWGDPQLAGIDWFTGRNEIVLQLTRQNLGPAVKDYLERFGDRLESDHVTIVERFEHLWPKVLQDKTSPRTIVHTDFRADNLLFDARGRVGSLVVLDWAGILHLSGLLDVGYFIGSALTAEQRRAHEHDLLAEYFAELGRYSLGDYGFDDCWQDYRRYPFYGLFTALLAQMMVERTERSDALFLQMGRQFSEMIADLGSLALWE